MLKDEEDWNDHVRNYDRQPMDERYILHTKKADCIGNILRGSCRLTTRYCREDGKIEVT